MPFVPAGFAPFSIDTRLARDTTLSLEDVSVRVLHTPGHTQGSVCFLFGLDCLAGDTLFQRGIGRTDLPGGDMHKIVFSIRNVLYALSPRPWCIRGMDLPPPSRRRSCSTPSFR